MYNRKKTQFLNLQLLQNTVILLAIPKHVHMLQQFQIEVKEDLYKTATPQPHLLCLQTVTT